MLINIALAILKMFLPAMMERKPDICEDAQRQPELKKRLQDRVRARFGTLVVLLTLLVLPVGCMPTRTIYIQPGEPVRLRETVKDVKIWTVDKNGKPLPGKVDLPEGWYCLPDNGSG